MRCHPVTNVRLFWLTLTLCAALTACSEGGNGESPWHLGEPDMQTPLIDIGRSDTPDTDTSTSQDIGNVEDLSPPDVRMADCQSAPPQARVVLDDEGDVLQYRIELDASGCIHVLYNRSGGEPEYTKTMHYTMWDGERWRKERVPLDATGHELALEIDEQGLPRVLATNQNEQQIVSVERQEDGSWREEPLIDARTSAMRRERAPDGRSLALIYTASPQYTSSNQRMRLFERPAHRESTWQERYITPLPIAADTMNLTIGPTGSVAFPFIGYTNGLGLDEVPNLWLAESTDASLTEWKTSQLDLVFGEVRSLIARQIGDTLHLIFINIYSYAPNGRSLTHLRRDADGNWQRQSVIELHDAPAFPYDLHVEVDDQNRLHAFFGQKPSSKDWSYAHHVFDGMTWRELESFEIPPSGSAFIGHMAFDFERQLIHLITKSAEEGVENHHLVYQALPLPSE